MDPRHEELKDRLLRKLSLRIGDEMAGYLHRRMTAAFATPNSDRVPIPILAQDARTGRPRAVSLNAADLQPQTPPQ